MKEPKQIPQMQVVLFPASIKIGGQIPERLVKGLAAAIAKSCKGGRHEKIWKQSLAERLLRASAESVTAFDLIDDEAEFGRFHDIEALCIENEIAFRRRSTASLEYNAEMLVFVPLNRRRPLTVQTSQNGEPVARLSELETDLKHGRKASVGSSLFVASSRRRVGRTSVGANRTPPSS